MRMKTFGIACLFLCVASLDVSAKVPRNVPAGRWPGCYELRPAPSDTGLYIFPNRDFIYSELPRRFALWTTPEYEMAIQLDADQWSISLWEGDETLRINWNNIFVGYEVILKESGSMLTGTAMWYSDSDLPVKINVEGHRIDCDSGEVFLVLGLNPPASWPPGQSR